VLLLLLLLQGIAKFDLATPATQKEAAIATIEWDTARGGEAFFVPRSQDPAQCNSGYLLAAFEVCCAIVSFGSSRCSCHAAIPLLIAVVSNWTLRLVHEQAVLRISLTLRRSCPAGNGEFKPMFFSHAFRQDGVSTTGSAAETYT
jgi:hypothetical protein